MDTPVRNNTVAGPNRCAVSWSAIFAGALVAFALSALFNLLNAGLGLVVFPESFRALTALSIAGYIWLIICGIIAMFIAGLVAGKVYRHYSPSACGGGLHGFLAWSVALLLTVIVAAHFAHATAETAAAGAKENRTAISTQVDENTDSETAKDRAENAADVLGGATLGVFFIFLLGAAAATAGGYVGARKDLNYLDR